MVHLVVACIVTYRRPAELNRLLTGLSRCGPALGMVIVVDNAAAEIGEGSLETAEAISKIQNPKLVYVSSENLGPGAGWKRGMETGLDLLGDRITHFWTLDDDVVVEPDTLDRLLAGLRLGGAEAAVPLLTDDHGELWAFPEPVKPELRRVLREARKPEDLLQRIGPEPREFCWCTGACVLVSRAAVEQVGFHRTDFWMLGEDLEYSMRLAGSFRCVFLPDLVVPHLPPPAKTPEAARLANHLKFCALLQNLSYLAFHSSNSRHMWQYLPGNFRRYFRTEGFSRSSVGDALYSLWQGAFKGVPRGGTGPVITDRRNNVDATRV